MNALRKHVTSAREWLLSRIDTLLRISTVIYLCVPILALLFYRYLEGVNMISITGLYVCMVIMGYYVLALQILLMLVFLVLVAWTSAALAVTGVILALALFWLAIDGTLYHIMHFHADAFWLSLAIKSFDSIGLSWSALILAAAILIAAGAVSWFLFRVSKRMPYRRTFVIGLTAVCLASLLAGQALHVLAYERNDMRITAITPRLPYYFPVRSHGTAAQHADLLTGIKGDMTDQMALSLFYPKSTFNLSGLSSGRRPNVLILLLESWRADSMNASITPNIHRLGLRSSVFKNHYSSGNCTTPGVFSLFFGIHPTYWDAVKSNSTYIHNPVLIDALKADGYTFGVFADSDFDRQKITDAIFSGIEVREKFTGDSPDSKDRDLNNRLLEFIRGAKASGRPFFGFAFYYSSHFGYYYPKDVARFKPAYKLNVFATGRRDRETYFNDYKNALYYTDQLIGDLLEGLKKSGALKNTIIVVTGDHGEEFDDNHVNFWGHAGNFTDYQTHVPLLIYVPWKEPRQVDQRTAHVDIPPTLMREGLGCVADVKSYSNGYDLFESFPSRRPIIMGSYINYAVAEDDDVYSVFPMYVQKYKRWNINAKAGDQRSNLTHRAVEEMSCFYRSDSSQFH